MKRRSEIRLALIGCLSMCVVGCSTSRSGVRLTPETAEMGSASESSSDGVPRPLSSARDSSAPSLETAALAYNEPAPTDATDARARATKCDGDRCSPVHTGPVDEYVSILDAGIPRFPQYPPLALREGVEGMVRVRALVGTDGSLCDAEIVDGPELLREPALQAAREANMSPAMKDGCPVPIWVVIPFEFSLPPGAPTKSARKTTR
jgi:TonB family protein